MSGAIARVLASQAGQAAVQGIMTRLGVNAEQAALLVTSAIGAGFAIEEIIRFYLNKQQASNPPADIVFPTDLLRINDLSEDLFFIKFQFKNYEKRSVEQSKKIQVNGPGIKLPLPKSLRDNLSVEYSKADLKSVAGVATDLIARGGGEYLRNIDRAISEGPLETFRAGVAPFANLGAAMGFQQFGDTLPGQAIQSIAGAAVNPYQTWLFKHPNFRTHNFNWTLAPESPEESVIIKNIIKLFQRNMLPYTQTKNNALLFQYPSLVYMQLFAGNPQNSKYLYDFKPCVLKSVSVDYAATGKPAFFTTNNQRGISGAPAVVSLTIDLQEIEYWTAQDIEQ